MNSLPPAPENASRLSGLKRKGMLLAQSLEEFNRNENNHPQEPIRIGNFFFQPCYGSPPSLYVRYQDSSYEDIWEIEIHNSPGNLKLVDLVARFQEWIYLSQEWRSRSPEVRHQPQLEFFELGDDHVFPNPYLKEVPFEPQRGTIGETGYTAAEIYNQIEEALTLLEGEICPKLEGEIGPENQTPLQELIYFLRMKWVDFKLRLSI